MTDSPSIIVAGIDVGKSKLDACILAGERERRFDNTKPGRRALHNWLLRHRVERVVFEPTGRYHRNLHQCLFDAGLETVLVNPLRSRRFAEAVGVLAKNDRVDAAMLARFGLLDGLEGTPPRPRNLLLLGDLLALRGKLVEQLAALRKLRDELDPGLAAGAGPGLGRAATGACATASRPTRNWRAAPRSSHPSPAAVPSTPLPVRRDARARRSRPPPGCVPVRHRSVRLAIPGGSAAGAPSRAACCPWPPSPRSAASPAPRPATNACALAASRPRSPWSRSCAGSRPGSARTVSGRPSRPPALRRRPRDRRAARRRNSAPAAFSYAPELDTGHGSSGLRAVPELGRPVATIPARPERKHG